MQVNTFRGSEISPTYTFFPLFKLGFVQSVRLWSPLKFWKIDFAAGFHSAFLFSVLWRRHVVRLNRTRGRDLDCREPGVCYHGGRARKGAPHGLNACRDETDLGYGPEGRGTISLLAWGGTKETGVLTRALAGNLRFRQTSSALEPSSRPLPPLPLEIPFSPLMSPLGSRATLFPGDGSPVRVALYRLWRESGKGGGHPGFRSSFQLTILSLRGISREATLASTRMMRFYQNDGKIFARLTHDWLEHLSFVEYREIKKSRFYENQVELTVKNSINNSFFIFFCLFKSRLFTLLYRDIWK